jgi:hypothetical protein
MDFVDLPGLRNEFLRRIGRNLWCYQQVEAQLKTLLTIGQGAFPVRDALSAATRRRAAVHARTLGQLVGDASGSVLAREDRSADSPVDWLAWSIRYDEGAEFSHDLTQRLQALVADRNVLVHGALGYWKLDSEASLVSGLGELDAQRERIVAVQDKLRRVLSGVHEAMTSMLAYIDSAEFTHRLREAHLKACLVDAVVRAARADGWTRLADAGQAFREHVARLPIAQQKALPKLSRLLEDSGLFEVREATGEMASMCRLKAVTT